MLADRRVLTLARVLSVLLVVVLATRIAWMGDDALITLRTALNITHGWGPGFNATEAVQAYTHPLWFVLWTLIGAATAQWVLGILALSLVLTGFAVGVLAWQTRGLARLVVAIGLLVLSNAFMEYATSGLENPLAYALLAVLVWLTLSVCAMGNTGSVTLKARAPWAVAFGLTIALVVLTRFDLALVVAPVVVVIAVTHRARWRVLLVGAVAAFVPVVLWLAWSWATYHTLLPNTFLAKRNVDIPTAELVIQGVRYLWVSMEHDPATAVALALGLGVAFAFGRTVVRAWAVGVLVYLAYVVWIGGDFMAGRFLAVPVFVAMLLFVVAGRSSRPDDASSTDATRPAAAGVAAALVGVLTVLACSVAAGSVPVALANPRQARWDVDQNLNAGVTDERGSNVANGKSLAGMIDRLSLGYTNRDLAPLGDGTGLNRELREIDHSARNWPTNDGTFTWPSEVGVFCGGLGNLGISVGPIAHLVDSCALTDRFLASMPFRPSEPFAWKPGHFHREVPAGYLDAIRFDDPTKVEDMGQRYGLQQLWEQIRR